jgi:hypothetical protein
MRTERMTAFLNRWVTPFLREQGFSRRGQKYTAKRGANSVVVRFQHRGDFFTCDLAVVSALLIGTMTEWEPPEHWTVRLGPIAVGYDKWWDLEDGEKAVAADFLRALEKGLQHIVPISTDEGLRDALLWLDETDRRGLIRMHARWLITLVGSVGLPGRASRRSVRLVDGGVLQLESPEHLAE